MNAVSHAPLRIVLLAIMVGTLAPRTPVQAVSADQTLSDYARLQPTTVPGDEYWDDRFSLEGISGPVYAVTVHYSLICIGGDFHQAGGFATNNIACWDTVSESWTTFGGGTSGPVYALASGGDGRLYAGGQFSQAGDASARNIARWNSGTQKWEALSEGVSGPVHALRWADRYIYAGGQFSQAGTTAANNVARWDTDTHTWSALAVGQSNGVSGPVYALAVAAGPFSSHDVFVGGSFAGIGGVSAVNAHNIARWNSDTRAWAEVSGGVSGPVYTLARCGSTLYAGGQFSQAGTLPAFNIAAWDTVAAEWSALGLGTSNTVEAIACMGNRVYVGGRFSQAGGVAADHVARWNTTSGSWAALGGGTSGPVFGIGIRDVHRDIYVGGQFASAGATASRNFARFTGDYDQSNPDDVNWNRLFCMAGPNNSVSSIAASDDMLYYGGGFTQAGGLAANHLAQYDTASKTWSAFGGGVNGDVEVITVSGDDVYIGGSFTLAGGAAAANIARWNTVSGQWSTLGSGTDGPVYAIAVSGEDVYVGGDFGTAGGVTVNHIARWDNGMGSWYPLGGGTWIGMNAPVRAIAISGSDVYAGGSFTYAQAVPANHVARWDGGSWYGLGSGLNSHVYDVALQGGDLYVAGYFSTAGGAEARSIARWDGANWHAMPGLVHTGRSIAFNMGEVYVGGEFSVPGGSVANGVARWDGAQWQPLGSGLGHSHALAVGPGGLYAGGGFASLANGLRCDHTALWHTRTTPAGTGAISGRVRDGAGVAVPGASVQVCLRSEAACTWTGTTDASGDYQAIALSDGAYLVQAYPPPGLAVLPLSPGPVTITLGISVQTDIDLPAIAAIPSGATLSPSRRTSAGVPLVNWREGTDLTIQGCTGGTATYQVLQLGAVLTEGGLAEGPAGQYSANLAALHPTSGYVQISVSTTCPNLTVTQSETFDVYVDPTGTVRDVSGQPIDGAQVTLYAFGPVTLSLTPVPEGDARLSPANGDNPDLTDASGHFGWDVLAGPYVVRAEKEGCVSPAIPNLAYVQTDVVQSPFAMVDLELRLDCSMGRDTVYLPFMVR